MSNNKKQIPQRKLGTALRSFFDHVTSYDEEGVHAALCIVANAVPTGMRICKFGDGDPNVLAKLTITAIETMIGEVPGFEEAFNDVLRAKRLQSMIKEVLDAVQQAEEQAAEAKGMEAVKPEVNSLS